ncbi:MAG: hypothetical protein NT018_10570 [Armatimonadetes bacterium]|nr:hypothetical protein [Armatimonadota bacterium]
MRKFLVVLGILAIVVMAGCGGGGGTATPTVAITLNGATPSQPNPTVEPIAALSLPAKPAGSAFVAAADCIPAGTTFSAPVTLTFHLVTPLPAGATLLLFETDAGDNWTQVPGIHPITVSADRLTLSVNVSKFSDFRYYAIFSVPVP